MRFAAVAGLILLLLVGAIFFLYEEDGVDQTYLLPAGYEGCVVIHYDIPDAPELKAVNNEIVYRVPEDGLIETSSPYDFGWVNEKHSGGFELKAFYVDEEGNRTGQLPQEEIGFGANGATQYGDGKEEEHYFYQFFGKDASEKASCPKIGI